MQESRLRLFEDKGKKHSPEVEVGIIVFRPVVFVLFFREVFVVIRRGAFRRRGRFQKLVTGISGPPRKHMKESAP
jgi:hypothetical protein